MKKLVTIIYISFFVFSACREKDINLFDKTADQRVAEAIAALKKDLTTPPNGWKAKYSPVPQSGSFYVLLDFNEDNTVKLKTDLSANDGDFFEQTITYRIDNSLGLELIFESDCFFSYLFEIDQASFGAEYEFIYKNKTTEGNLVFKSKTDLSDPTILVFEEATPTDENLLGTTLASNLNTISKDLKEFRPYVPLTYLKLVYDNKDLAMYVSINELKRTINFTAAFKKTDTLTYQSINLSTAYVVRGDSLVLDVPLKRTLLGNVISLRSIKLEGITNTTLTLCADPIAMHSFEGVTSSNDIIRLQTSLVDMDGRSFAQLSTYYVGVLANIFNKGVSSDSVITKNIPGALEMELFYNFRLSETKNIYGVGFYIQSTTDTVFVLKEFTPTLNANNLIFDFKPDYTFLDRKLDVDTSPHPSIDLNKIDTYLNYLTDGNKTYLYKISDGIFEFNNPCTGWSFVFINPQ